MRAPDSRHAFPTTRTSVPPVSDGRAQEADHTDTTADRGGNSATQHYRLSATT